jgi:hypothetical protein
MNKSNYKEIWSTPIADYYMEDDIIHNEVVLALNKKYEVTSGQQFNFVEAGGCDNFKKWFLEKCQEYTSRFLIDPECSIKRSWVTTLLYGQHNHHHQHGDSDIVGVYYVNTIPEHPPLQIFDPRLPHSMNTFNIVNGEGVRICENIRYMLVPPKNRTLILFPGYLLHGVETNLSQIPRSSIAINVKVNFKISDMPA